LATLAVLAAAIATGAVGLTHAMAATSPGTVSGAAAAAAVVNTPPMGWAS